MKLSIIIRNANDFKFFFSKKKNIINFTLKGVFAKNERGYMLNAINKRF